jgi:hypothetical protein
MRHFSALKNNSPVPGCSHSSAILKQLLVAMHVGGIKAFF